MTTSPRRVLLLMFAVTMAVACESSPLTAPVASTISIAVESTTLQPGESTDVWAVVTEEAGTAVQNGTVVQFSTTLGMVEESAETSAGVAHVTFTAGSVTGTAKVTATSGAATSTAPGNTIDIVIGSTIVIN